MPSYFASSFAPNVSGQLFARIISFCLNMYLFRIIDGTTLGIVNVSLTLFYTTSIFLVREPFRKAFLPKDVPLACAINHLWLSPLLCPFVCTALYFVVWLPFSMQPPPSVVPSYGFAVFAFGISACLEAVAEPFVVIALRARMDSQFAFLQALLIVLQRIIVLALIYTTNLVHIDIFCYAQLCSSLVYLLCSVFFIHHRMLLKRNSDVLGVRFRDLFPNLHAPLNKRSCSALMTFAGHSLFKQILTDGAGYVLTFLGEFSFSNQAVYDAIDKLGSLVARIVLAPLEHSAFLYFSANLKRGVSAIEQNQEDVRKAVNALLGLLHLVILIGIVVCVFAFPYSRIAVSIYGGEFLVRNSGAAILRLYCVYILVIAVNGITECFAMATMSNMKLVAHGGFLSVTATIHIALSVLLALTFGILGLVVANCITMILRISYCWHHIEEFLCRQLRFRSLLPSFSIFIFLFFCLCVTSLSFLIFGRESGLMHNSAHISVGGSLLIFLMNHIYHNDAKLARFLNEHFRSANANTN